jgi:hypothetical protein
MCRKLLCDVCGKEIVRGPGEMRYTYDMVIKKRDTFIDGEAYLDVCYDCLFRMGLLQYIKKMS